MKTTIIYHQVKEGVDCPDGLAAAWVAAKYLPKAQLIGWTYQANDVPIVEVGDKLIIVDFSFPASVMESWASSSVDVVVIDHHKTAMENLQGLSDRILARFDMNECGATLTWKTFFPDQPMPAFLEYVRDRDLWNHVLPMTEEIHEATSALRRSFALFDVLEQMNREELIKFLAPLGGKLLKPKRDKIKAIAKRYDWRNLKVPRTIEAPDGDISWADEYQIPLVVLAKDGSEDRLTSDVGSYLYKSLPKALFVACITSDGSWSLRSDKHGNNTDVGAIAKALGGGGHHNAAGFKP